MIGELYEAKRRKTTLLHDAIQSLFLSLIRLSEYSKIVVYFVTVENISLKNITCKN